MLERVMPWLGSFRDQVVLITGASSGIGRETAVSFARQGAALALAARRREQLEETAHAVTAAGGRALVIPTDVTNQESTHAAVAAVKREWKRIDILVNNAGILKPSRVEALTAADFEAMLKVNVFGALFMMQAVLPVMRKQKQGTIINVASLAGRRGVSPLGGYCATKFALVGLTEALRTELDDRTIHIGLVMPGVIDTPMVENAKVSEMAEVWPSMLNMPVEWVATIDRVLGAAGCRDVGKARGAGPRHHRCTPALVDRRRADVCAQHPGGRAAQAACAQEPNQAAGVTGASELDRESFRLAAGAIDEDDTRACVGFERKE